MEGWVNLPINRGWSVVSQHPLRWRRVSAEDSLLLCLLDIRPSSYQPWWTAPDPRRRTNPREQAERHTPQRTNNVNTVISTSPPLRSADILISSSRERNQMVCIMWRRFADCAAASPDEQQRATSSKTERDPTRRLTLLLQPRRILRHERLGKISTRRQWADIESASMPPIGSPPASSMGSPAPPPRALLWRTTRLAVGKGTTRASRLLPQKTYWV